MTGRRTNSRHSGIVYVITKYRHNKISSPARHNEISTCTEEQDLAAERSESRMSCVYIYARNQGWDLKGNLRSPWWLWAPRGALGWRPGPHRASWSGVLAPWTPPGAASSTPQDALRCLQEGPRRFQEAFKTPQDRFFLTLRSP